MNRKTRILIIVSAIIVMQVLIFWVGGFHFSKSYLIGRNIPPEKIERINCDFWKENGNDRVLEYDFLEFDKTACLIEGDTLYIGGKPAAKAVSLVHRCFIDYELTIQSFDGLKTGSYVSK